MFKALKAVKSSVSKDDLKKQEQWTAKFGSEGN